MDQEPRQPHETKTFAPAASHGWAWPAGLAGVLAISAILRVTGDASTLATIASAVVFTALIVWMIAVAVEFRRLTYEVGPDAIVLRYGRLARYRIDRSDLARVVCKDLRFSPWASVRFPGLALYNVPYRGDGIIKMCASRSHRDVLVLETRQGARYGCTPADPAAFLEAVGGQQVDVRPATAGTTGRHR